MSRHVDNLVSLADELAGELLGLLDVCEGKDCEDAQAEAGKRLWYLSDDIKDTLNRYEEARADLMYAMTKRSAA